MQSLVLWGTFARSLWAKDYDIGVDPASADAFIGLIRERWGTGHALGLFSGGVDDPETLESLARYERQTASPGAAATILRHNVNMDVRHALGAIRVPTLVVHRTGDPVVPIRQARYLAEHIADATLVEIPGNFHASMEPGDEDAAIDVIAEFITGAPVQRDVDVDRVLMTVLFTDIVDSTAHAASMGDKAWSALLEQHDAAAARAVERHKGVVVKRTGDGLLATFRRPGPRRACRARGAAGRAAARHRRPRRAAHR